MKTLEQAQTEAILKIAKERDEYLKLLEEISEENRRLKEIVKELKIQLSFGD